MIKSIKRENKFSLLQKVIVVTFAAFAIVFCIISFYMKKQEENYKKIKMSSSNYLVYTKYQDEGDGSYYILVPYVNIKGEVVKAINEDIDLFLNDFIHDKNSVITYEYEINGFILSIIIKVIDYDTEYAPHPYFRGYNINLETQELISDESLLSYFGVNEEFVSAKISNQLLSYYDDLVRDNYYHSAECDYSCFLKYREIDNVLDNVVFYIKSGKLIAYRPFIFMSIYGEEEYFEDKDFEFTITE